jgi:hypothetical protein
MKYHPKEKPPTMREKFRQQSKNAAVSSVRVSLRQVETSNPTFFFFEFDIKHDLSYEVVGGLTPGGTPGS